jgi:hypothetical protein
MGRALLEAKPAGGGALSPRIAKRTEMPPFILGERGMLVKAAGEGMLHPPPSGPRGRAGKGWLKKASFRTNIVVPTRPRNRRACEQRDRRRRHEG